MESRAARGLGLGLVALIAAITAHLAQAQDGLEDFEVVWQVFSHPRCTNCHASGDVPTVGEDGWPHPMAVVRGEEGEGVPGLSCSACHPDTKVAIAGGPPTAPHWQMPGRQTPMSFVGRSQAALCAQLKDPRATGKPDLIEAIKHVLKDPLVAWSFDPGAGRGRPPVTRQVFFEHLAKWAKAGAPCPSE